MALKKTTAFTFFALAFGIVCLFLAQWEPAPVLPKGRTPHQSALRNAGHHQAEKPLHESPDIGPDVFPKIDALELSGRVFGKDGMALAEVMIQAHPSQSFEKEQAWDRYSPASVTTESGGRFLLRVPFRKTMRGNGGQPFFLRLTHPNHPETLVKFDPLIWGTYSQIDNLELELNEFATLEGTLITPQGNAATNQVVRAWCSNLEPKSTVPNRRIEYLRPNGEFTCETDYAGRFAFVGLPAGKYCVGSAPEEIELDDALQYGFPVKVVSTSEKDLSLIKGERESLVVTLADPSIERLVSGEKLADSDIIFVEYGEAPRSGSSTRGGTFNIRKGKDGSFRLPVKLSGKERIQIAAPGHRPLSFNIQDGKAEGVNLNNLHLEKKPSLTFRVTNAEKKPIENCWVFVTPHDSTPQGPNGSKQTDAKGVVVFDDLARGDYKLRLDHPDYLRHVESRSSFPDSSDLDYTIVLDHGREAFGTFRPANATRQEINCWIYEWNTEAQPTHKDIQGLRAQAVRTFVVGEPFHLSGMPTGRFVLFLKYAQHDYFSQPVEADHGSPAEVRFNYPNFSRVHGVLRDPEGQALANEVVFLRRGTKSNAAMSDRAITDSLGRYSFPAVPEGEWSLCPAIDLLNLSPYQFEESLLSPTVIQVEPDTTSIERDLSTDPGVTFTGTITVNGVPSGGTFTVLGPIQRFSDGRWSLRILSEPIELNYGFFRTPALRRQPANEGYPIQLMLTLPSGDQIPFRTNLYAGGKSPLQTQNIEVTCSQVRGVLVNAWTGRTLRPQDTLSAVDGRIRCRVHAGTNDAIVHESFAKIASDGCFDFAALPVGRAVFEVVDSKNASGQVTMRLKHPAEGLDLPITTTNAPLTIIASLEGREGEIIVVDSSDLSVPIALNDSEGNAVEFEQVGELKKEGDVVSLFNFPVGSYTVVIGGAGSRFVEKRISFTHEEGQTLQQSYTIKIAREIENTSNETVRSMIEFSIRPPEGFSQKDWESVRIIATDDESGAKPVLYTFADLEQGRNRRYILRVPCEMYQSISLRILAPGCRLAESLGTVGYHGDQKVDIELKRQ